MTIKYIADDGTEFADKWCCESYEYKQRHPNLLKVEFYNENHERLDTWDVINPYGKKYMGVHMDDVFEIVIQKESVKEFAEFARKIYFGRSDCKSWEAGTYRYAFDNDGDWIFTKVSK